MERCFECREVQMFCRCKGANPTPTKDIRLEDIIAEMVENTVIFLTKDLPSLLEQDKVFEIRRQHKDDILKNIPEAKRAIESQYIKRSDLKELIESARPEKETFVKGDGDGSRQFNDYANGFNCGIKEYEYNLLNKIKEKR